MPRRRSGPLYPRLWPRSTLGRWRHRHHRQIEVVVEELEQVTGDPLTSESVRRLLYGLQALRELHLQEDEVHLPIVARPSPARARCGSRATRGARLLRPGANAGLLEGGLAVTSDRSRTRPSPINGRSGTLVAKGRAGGFWAS
jgi:hypothetical protein